MINGTCQLDRE